VNSLGDCRKHNDELSRVLQCAVSELLQLVDDGVSHDAAERIIGLVDEAQAAMTSCRGRVGEWRNAVVKGNAVLHKS